MAAPLLGFATRVIARKSILGDDEQIDPKLLEAGAQKLVTDALTGATISIEGKITVNRNFKTKFNKALDNKVDEVMSYALQEVQPITPYDSVTPSEKRKGRPHARNQWKIIGKGKRSSLYNTAPYISYLDSCTHSWHSSRRGHSAQAPDGIIIPLIKKIQEKFE